MRPTRLLLAAALLAASALEPARSAHASTPGVTNCTVPQLVHLVGMDGSGAPAPIGQFTVVLRDLANNPAVGARVKFSLASVTDVAASSSQPDPTLDVDCIADVVSKLTDANGQATFSVVGRGTGAFSTEATGCTGLIYWADFPGFGDVAIGQVIVTTFDLDGSGDVGGSDLSVFIGQFAMANGSRTCDYDNSGFIGGGDLALWLTAFASGQHIQSSGLLCQPALPAWSPHR